MIHVGVCHRLLKLASSMDEEGWMVRPIRVAQEFVPEGNWAGTDWQVSGPVETVAIPVMVSEESWMKDYGND